MPSLESRLTELIDRKRALELRRGPLPVEERKEDHPSSGDDTLDVEIKHLEALIEQLTQELEAGTLDQRDGA